MKTKNKKPKAPLRANSGAPRKPCNYPRERPGQKRGEFKIKLTGGKVIVVRAPLIQQNGQTRPTDTWSDGSPKITALVWKFADELSVKLKRPPTRLEMIMRVDAYNKTAAPAMRLTFSVFSNQFYRWRKFNGIHGRKKLDGTMANCTGGPRRYQANATRPEVVAALAIKPPVAVKGEKPAKPVLPKKIVRAAPAKPPVVITSAGLAVIAKPAAPAKPAASAKKSPVKAPAKVKTPAKPKAPGKLAALVPLVAPKPVQTVLPLTVAAAAPALAKQ